LRFETTHSYIMTS